MTCCFAVEPYWMARPEANDLLKRHAEEVADAVSSPDDKEYLAMDRAGVLHVVTARQDRKLIGYHCSIIRRHLHHEVLTAFTDAVFLAPEYRRGSVGTKMLQFAEKTLQRRGVKWLYIASTTKHDISSVLKHAGFKHVEDIYLKEMT